MTDITFYKFVCKDEKIKDFYIASSNNFKRSINDHQFACICKSNPNYNNRLYRFIRDNGGWDNWKTETIKNIKCETKKDIDTNKRKIMDELKPTLNKVRPLRTREEYMKEHSEHLKQKKKEYIEKNKEKIKERQSQIYFCDCGSVVKIYGKPRHEKSKKHQNFINSL